MKSTWIEHRQRCWMTTDRVQSRLVKVALPHEHRSADISLITVFALPQTVMAMEAIESQTNRPSPTQPCELFQQGHHGGRIRQSVYLSA
jgi:hypothetical protein